MSRRGENIRKRSDGRWEGRYIICSSDGHKKYRSVYSRTYKGVKQKLMKFKVATVILQADPNETDVNHQSMTIEDLSQQWLSYVADHRKYSTYRKYAGIYEKYIKKSFGDIRTEELRSEMIASVLPKDLSSSLYQSIYCVFNRILDYGNQYYGTVKMHLVPVITKTVSKPIGTLNIYEQQKLVEYLSNDIDIYKAGILICLFMGLRLGEICALKWEDIDFQNRILHIKRTVQRLDCTNTESRSKTILFEGPPKTVHSIREIPIPEFLYNIILSYNDSPCKGIYFLNPNTPMDPRTYQYKFQSILKKAGIESTHFHALRHTFATNCINSGADAKSVSEILGHANVNITLNRYVHPDMDTKRNILNSIYSKHSESDEPQILRGQL